VTGTVVGGTVVGGTVVGCVVGGCVLGFVVVGGTVDGTVVGTVVSSDPPNSAPKIGATFAITTTAITSVTTSRAHIMIKVICFGVNFILNPPVWISPIIPLFFYNFKWHFGHAAFSRADAHDTPESPKTQPTIPPHFTPLPLCAILKEKGKFP
jgi:hypothetical protein